MINNHRTGGKNFRIFIVQRSVLFTPLRYIDIPTYETMVRKSTIFNHYTSRRDPEFRYDRSLYDREFWHNRAELGKQAFRRIVNENSRCTYPRDVRETRKICGIMIKRIKQMRHIRLLCYATVACKVIKSFDETRNEDNTIHHGGSL